MSNQSEIKSFSSTMQQSINHTSGKISELLKLLNNKLKEVQAIDDKIRVIQPSNLKKHSENGKIETEKLKLALEKEKKDANKVMKNIQKRQNELIQTVASYDKKFVNKNKNELKDLLTFINLQVKGQMSLPYFKNAYTNFLSFIISSAKNFTSSQLKNYQSTAIELTNKYWKKYLDEAKKQWEDSEKTKPKKGGKKEKKENKSSNKSSEKKSKRSKKKDL